MGIDIDDIEEAALADVVWLQDSRRDYISIKYISIKKDLDGPWLYKPHQQMDEDDWSLVYAWRVRRHLRSR